MGIRNFLLLLPVIILPILVNSQDGRGASVELARIGQGKIRAVIVGISNYKNLPEKSQLRYAEPDARLMSDFLAGHPATDSIIMLLNEQATSDKFRASINTLIKMSKENDAVLVYFAGHGNVQSDIEEGFLLFSNVTPSDTDYFADDAFKLSDLRDYGKLCGKRKVKFILITDACRSGTIFNAQGATNTLSVLNSEWDYSAKLISCQPTQESYEYKELGHGVFTYYLVQALSGGAQDENRNQALELFELKEFVTKPVRDKTGFKQIPSWSGNDLYQIIPQYSFVESNVLASNAPVGNSGKQAREGTAAWEEMLNYPMVKAFYDAIEKKNFITEPLFNKKVTIGDAKSLHVHQDISYSLAIDPKGYTLAVGSNKDKSVKIIDIQSTQPKVISQLTSTDGNRILKFSPDGKQLISGSWSGNITFYDLTTSAKVKTFKPPDRGPHTFAVSNDGKHLATGGATGKIIVWSLPELRPVNEIDAHAKSITELQFDLTDQFIYSVSEDRLFKVSPVNGSGSKSSFAGHQAAINALILDPLNTFAFTGDESGYVIKWDLVSRKKIAQVKLSGYVMNINDLSLSTDGNFLLVAGKQYSMTVLASDKLEEVTQFVKSSRGITNALLAQTSNRIFATTYGGDFITVEITLPSPSAYALYKSNLEGNKALSKIAHKINSDLTAELLAYAQSVIEPFILGSAQLPIVNEIDKAIGCLQKAIEINEGSEVIKKEAETRIEYLKGMRILQANQYSLIDQAISHFNSVLQKDSRATYPYNALALAYKKKNELQQANEKLNSASKQIPSWTEPIANLGINAMYAAKWDEARKHFQSIISLEPNSPKGHRLMGDLELEQGNLVLAESAYKKSLALDAGSPLLLCRMADIEHRRGNFKMTEAELKKIIQTSPDFDLAYAQLADVYISYFGKYDRNKQFLSQAYEHLLQAKEINPYAGEYYFLIGNLFSTALLYLPEKESASIFPHNAYQENTWKDSLFQQANNWYSLSLSMDPYSWRYLLAKAILSGKYEGKATGQQILNSDKNIKGFYRSLMLGAYAYEFENYEEAEKQLNQCFNEGGHLPATFIYLAKSMGQQPLNATTIKKWETYIPKYWGNSPEVLNEFAIAIQRLTQGGATSFLTQAIQTDAQFTYAKMVKQTQLKTSWKFSGLDGFTMDVSPFSATQSLAKAQTITYLVNEKGFILAPMPYQDIRPVDSNLLFVSSNKKWGIIKISGEILLPLEYDALLHQGNIALVTQQNLKGIYSMSNQKWIAHLEYEDLKILNQCIAVKKDRRWGAVSTEGRRIAGIKYDHIEEATWKMKKVVKATTRGVLHYYSYDGICLNCK